MNKCTSIEKERAKENAMHEVHRNTLAECLIDLISGILPGRKEFPTIANLFFVPDSYP